MDRKRAEMKEGGWEGEVKGVRREREGGRRRLGATFCHLNSITNAAESENRMEMEREMKNCTAAGRGSGQKGWRGISGQGEVQGGTQALRSWRLIEA